MRKNTQILSILLAGIAMFAMIIDSKTAFSGASEGISLCIKVVIPSLFPFMIVSMILTGFASELHMVPNRTLQRWLTLTPQGFKVYLIGLLGGYPVGAQCIKQAYTIGTISKSDAERMLAFSNNAGPAFIFGIGLHILGQPWMCWAVWIIHILASCITAALTPVHTPEKNFLKDFHNDIPKQSHLIQHGVVVISTVCSWIILFKVILAFLERWLLWLLPQPLAITISGLLELANGITNLSALPSPEIRMILFSTLLGFGGICVLLQTKTVLAESGLSCKNYFPGKLMHGAVSFLLSLLVASFAYRKNLFLPYFIPAFVSVLLCIFYRISFIKHKNGIAFFLQPLYNGKKSRRLSL